MPQQLRGHVLSPHPEGGLFFQRDSGLAWDSQGVLTSPTGSGGGHELLVPGLVDVHVHLPQLRVRGRFQEKLLPWLRNHIWPEEERFAERSYRAEVTREFREGLLAAGTTSAMVYGSPEGSSAFAVLEDLGPVRAKGGDILMDRNGPDGLLREAGEALREAEEHGVRFAERYALTPRFVPTCSAELMQGCGELLASQGVRLQTHLAENPDELAWVAELHPERRSYTDVYAHFGLLGPRSIFGHCIYLDDEDLQLLADSGSWVAHCPTSNVALSSGRMPVERLEAAGVRWALATDVGAGPELSMLHVMHCFREVHKGHFDVSPGRALRAATLDAARSIGDGALGGALLPGRRADVVALRIPGGLRRGEDGEQALARILDAFVDRWTEAIAGVWIGGERVV